MIGLISLLATFQPNDTYGIGIGILSLIFISSIGCFIFGIIAWIKYHKISPNTLINEIKEKSKNQQLI